MHKIVMPALGQTTDELRIIAWRKAEGEVVAVGEPLFEVETDKASIEVESAFAGTLIKIVHGPDAIVHTGSVIAYIGVPGEVIPSDEVERLQEAQTSGTIAAASPPEFCPNAALLRGCLEDTAEVRMRELAALVSKLRWIGMEEEAVRLQKQTDQIRRRQNIGFGNFLEPYSETD